MTQFVAYKLIHIRAGEAAIQSRRYGTSINRPATTFAAAGGEWCIAIATAALTPACFRIR